MEELKKHDGVKGSNIEGYDMLSSNGEKCNTSIQEHPGFMRIVQLLNERPHEIRTWMRTGDVQISGHSLLWNHMETKDPCSLSRSRLLQRLENLTRVAAEHRELKSAHEALQAACAAQDRELLQMRVMRDEDRAQAEDFFQRLMSKIAECGTLRRQIIALDPLQPLP